MTELWARIEPLLGLVQEPARHLGCEDGAVMTRHDPGRASWLLASPDTDEIGLPNQGMKLRTHHWIDDDDLRCEVMPLGDDARLASLGAPVVAALAVMVGA